MGAARTGAAPPPWLEQPLPPAWGAWSSLEQPLPPAWRAWLALWPGLCHPPIKLRPQPPHHQHKPLGHLQGPLLPGLWREAQARGSGRAVPTPEGRRPVGGAGAAAGEAPGVGSQTPARSACTCVLPFRGQALRPSGGPMVLPMEVGEGLKFPCGGAVHTRVHCRGLGVSGIMSKE